MKLYLLTGQVAFLCRCYGQGHSAIQAAIDLIEQLASTVVRILQVSKQLVPQLYLFGLPFYSHFSLSMK